MESKFISLKMVATEAGWLLNLLSDMSLLTILIPSISIHCDCQVAIIRAKNKLYNGKKKHMFLRHNIVTQIIENRVITLAL